MARIWCFYGCGIGSGYSSDSVPSLGTSMCHGSDPRKAKNQTNKKKKSKQGTSSHWVRKFYLITSCLVNPEKLFTPSHICLIHSSIYSFEFLKPIRHIVWTVPKWKRLYQKVNPTISSSPWFNVVTIFSLKIFSVKGTNVLIFILEQRSIRSPLSPLSPQD